MTGSFAGRQENTRADKLGTLDPLQRRQDWRANQVTR